MAGNAKKAEVYYEKELLYSDLTDKDKAVLYYGMAESRRINENYSGSKESCDEALKYAQNLMPSMSIFLTNGCLEIDNNAAERAVKGFVIGRKNWLFSNTSKGAKSSAIIYSIVETAKANGLAVERYLVYLFDKLSECNDMNLLEKYMPWSIELPDSLYSKLKK